MYLGLIQVGNAHEHQYPVEHADSERRVLPQVMRWLSKIFRASQNELDGKPDKQQK